MKVSDCNNYVLLFWVFYILTYCFIAAAPITGHVWMLCAAGLAGWGAAITITLRFRAKNSK